MTEAAKLARKRVRLERQLHELSLIRWRTAMELRAEGVSMLDLGDLFDITKARAQQLVREAEQHYGVTVDQLRDHLAAGGLVRELLVDEPDAP